MQTPDKTEHIYSPVYWFIFIVQTCNFATNDNRIAQNAEDYEQKSRI